jgi:hypothetical protein
MQSQRHHCGGGIGTIDAKDAAFLAQLVVVEWIGDQHLFACRFRPSLQIAAI